MPIIVLEFLTKFENSKIYFNIVKDNNMTEDQKRFIEMYSFEQKKYPAIEIEMDWTRAYIKEH